MRVGTIDLIGKRDDNSGVQDSKPAAQQQSQQAATTASYDEFDDGSDIPF